MQRMGPVALQLDTGGLNHRTWTVAISSLGLQFPIRNIKPLISFSGMRSSQLCMVVTRPVLFILKPRAFD